MSERRFGAFEGVFVPTILTILGVIMYLRLGMVVGHAGLGGAILIILLAQVVSVSTGLSISSIATNKKMGMGGTYYLISRSLGLEVGSAIGIPLYISQALGGAMYIIGFTEAWVALFPGHSVKTVSAIVLVSITAISIWSAKWALKLQFVILAVIAASLVSIFAGKADFTREVVLWNASGEFPFWMLFAIFFPAVTGIEAGAALSGEVKDPEKNIPRGMLWAIGISMVIYLGLAVWFYFAADARDLQSNNTIAMKIARWQAPLIAGIMGATLSSALGSILGAPRTLMALGSDRALPFKKFWTLQTKSGEPWAALLITAFVILGCVITVDLNTIAPLLTMFFLITYGMVNSVLALEQSLGIPSFRPAFRIPTFIPFIGAVWCFAAMFLIHPVFAAVSFVATAGIYLVQAKRGIHSQWGDLRSGIFLALAEWSLKISKALPGSAKTWKPSLLILKNTCPDWKKWNEIVIDLVRPHGTARVLDIEIQKHSIRSQLVNSVKILFGRNPDSDDDLKGDTSASAEAVESEEIIELLAPFKKEGIFAAVIPLEASDVVEAFNLSAQTTQGMHFPPNIAFFPLDAEYKREGELEEMLAIAVREKFGVCLYFQQPEGELSKKNSVKIWVDLQHRGDDLLLLLGYQLATAREAEMTLLHTVKDSEDVEQSNRMLKILSERARLPAATVCKTHLGSLEQAIESEEPGDINLFQLSTPIEWDSVRDVYNSSGGSCLFVLKSGFEKISA